MVLGRYTSPRLRNPFTLFKNLLGDVEYFGCRFGGTSRFNLHRRNDLLLLVQHHGFVHLIQLFVGHHRRRVWRSQRTRAKEHFCTHGSQPDDDSWRSFSRYFGFHRDHIPSDKLLAQLKDGDTRFRSGLRVHGFRRRSHSVHPARRKCYSIRRRQRNDQLGLRRVLRKRSLPRETSRDPKFRLRSDPIGLEKDMDRVSKEISKQEGTYENLETKEVSIRRKKSLARRNCSSSKLATENDLRRRRRSQKRRVENGR